LTRVLTHIGELATCPPGGAQGDAGLISDAAMIVEDDRVQWCGPAEDLPPTGEHAERIDCRGRLVIPGLVDCHTHLCFGGWRGNEFAQRIAGASYQDIVAAGGGIRSTVSATRQSTREELAARARSALDGMLALGVTTVECKSGYGLDHDTEIRQLEVYRDLQADHAIDLVPTFLGAHIIPAEYENNRADYIDLLCRQVLPEVAERKLALFCDVFVEQNAFSVSEARQILQTADRLGLGLKVHAEQLSHCGGAELAAELGAVSAEHLEHISERGMAAMAASGTVAVSLPIASLYLGEGFLPARSLIETGVSVAVATDFNPGSAPSYHLPLALMLACTQQAMTPAEALCGATSIAARAVGLKGRAGSLVTGSRADLAIMDAPDLNHWLYHFQPNACRGVMKAGKWAVPYSPTP
jgi:imidazolonepropionase